MGSRARQVYFAKLAEQTERYDEMAAHMGAIATLPEELSVEERNLFSVAYKNAVGCRRAAWRILNGVEHKETTKGNEAQAKTTAEYRARIEAELLELCEAVLAVLDSDLIAKSTTGEAKVFYKKMKADYYRYIAEVSDSTRNATEKARVAYEEAWKEAEADLAVTHPIRLGLALNYSVFLYEVVTDGEEACKMARAAFEAAIAGLDDVAEDSYKDSALVMQLLRDNLTLWTTTQDESP